MKKLVTVALLLLGLAAGMPYRALGAEETISMPRAQEGILEHASGMSMLLSIVGLGLGFACGVCSCPIFPPWWIICAILGAIITYFITFPFEFIQSIASCPYRFVNWVVWNLRQLIDACVPF